MCPARRHSEEGENIGVTWDGSSGDEVVNGSLERPERSAAASICLSRRRRSCR